MVTAMHPLAAEAGVELLEKGGNAADAAIATALAVGVVEPFMSGLGGCAYALAFDARRKRTLAVDGSALVPLAADQDTFELLQSGAVSAGLYGFRATKGDAAETGYKAIAVPGAPAALGKLRDAMGTKPWSELVAPAFRLADEGFPIDEYLFAQSAASVSRLRAFPETTSIFLHQDGTARVPGFQGAEPERLYQPTLAKTLAQIAQDGPSELYRGPMGEAIVAHVQKHGGLLTLRDLESYEARILDPLDVTYRGRRIRLLPDTSGGPTVTLALNILENFALDSLAPDSAERFHLIAEALRLSFMDRFRHMGDPKSVRIPLEHFLTKLYAAERASLVQPEGRRADSFPWSEEGSGSGDAAGQHTTHINAVDSERNMVSLTATLGARFGSGVTVPDLGVVLNNGMMWFDPEPGHTASISPGKRALHAAAPAFLFDGERPIAAFGSPGGRKIMSAVLQVLLYLVDHGMPLQDAIQAPRIHCEVDPPLLVEAHVPEATVKELRERGHPVSLKQETFLSSYFGRPTGILVDEKHGCLRSGAEPYRVSAAVGY
jgi:gamma-glutamyltranspeptidase/glutathione hydrolase